MAGTLVEVVQVSGHTSVNLNFVFFSWNKCLEVTEVYRHTECIENSTSIIIKLCSTNMITLGVNFDIFRTRAITIN